MAKRPQRKPPDRTDRIVDAALALAVEHGWRGVSLAAVARKARLPLADVYRACPSRSAILDAFARRIDLAVLATADAELAGETPRDRLFDVLMRRFDALAPHRQAVAAIVADLPREPPALALFAPCFARSMACMLEAAGLSTTGVRGALRVKGLGAVYLVVLRTWLGDDDPDLARTMAMLDRMTRRAESLAALVGLNRADNQQSGADVS